MKNKTHLLLYTYLILWFLINTLFLTDYPFVHADEPWLSGLSRSMIEHSDLSSTEDFFDLYERAPHAIKIIFHMLQIFFIKVFGYSIFSVRLLSLTAGLFSLFMIYRVVNNLLTSKKSKIIPFFTMVLLSLDSLFIYISHFARQEIFLILLTLIILDAVTDREAKWFKKTVIPGLIIGLAVGIHPNSFIIAWPFGLFIVWEILRHRSRWSSLAIFILLATTITSIFIIISFRFNTNFIRDYSAYGTPVGVMDSVDIKLMKLPQFYYKIFNRISGTYYNPDIRLQMILFPLLLLIGILRKRSNITLLGFIGFNIGLVIIGKYSQPSISLLLPYFYISTIFFTEAVFINKKYFFIPFIVLSLLLTGSSIYSDKERYSDYIVNISSVIPNNGTVLGNILNDYALFKGQLYSWRNLEFLSDNGYSIETYIDERNIEYIILAEELSYIYENRPYWNVLYGNITNWYPELTDFTKYNCILIEEFISSGYGQRINALRNERDWYVKIYKVNYSESIRE